MRAKELLDRGIDYSSFEDPYSGIITMVFVQAANDLAGLKGREFCHKDGGQIRKWEIINFAHSEWADYLAPAVNLDIKDVNKLFNRLAGIEDKEEENEIQADNDKKASGDRS